MYTIYEDWVNQGLPKDAVTGECFNHTNSFNKIDPEILKETALMTPSGRVGMYVFDLSIAFTSQTWLSTYTAAQIALTAAHKLLQLQKEKEEKGKVAAIYGLCRPPGHHANCCVAGGKVFIYKKNGCIYINRRGGGGWRRVWKEKESLCVCETFEIWITSLSFFRVTKNYME